MAQVETFHPLSWSRANFAQEHLPHKALSSLTNIFLHLSGNAINRMWSVDTVGWAGVGFGDLKGLFQPHDSMIPPDTASRRQAFISSHHTALTTQPTPSSPLLSSAKHISLSSKPQHFCCSFASSRCIHAFPTACKTQTGNGAPRGTA